MKDLAQTKTASRCIAFSRAHGEVYDPYLTSGFCRKKVDVVSHVKTSQTNWDAWFANIWKSVKLYITSHVIIRWFKRFPYLTENVCCSSSSKCVIFLFLPARRLSNGVFGNIVYNFLWYVSTGLLRCFWKYAQRCSKNNLLLVQCYNRKKLTLRVQDLRYPNILTIPVSDFGYQMFKHMDTKNTLVK